MRQRKVTGIVLKRVNFREADKIFTILTREEGKISVVAKGVRRIKSRRAAHLELFNLVQISLHEGRGMPLVTEAKLQDSFPEAKADLKTSGYFFYLAEVVDKLLPDNQPHPEVFDLLLSTLGSLSKQVNAEGEVKKFVIQLFWNLGYLPKGEYPKIGVTAFVEEIIEKRIKSRKFLEEI